jgi:hypothetical protein
VIIVASTIVVGQNDDRRRIKPIQLQITVLGRSLAGGDFEMKRNRDPRGDRFLL